jgi:diaminopimelate epimerase
MGGFAFEKYEGLGNDFIVVEAEREADAGLTPERARALCDRRFGIGADGVLLVLPPDNPAHAARMRVLNSDGSIPEMCGNGLRCVALQLAARSPAGADALLFSVETDAGVRRSVVEGTEVTVEMGAVRWLGDREIEIDGVPVTVAIADAGNPHAIRFDLPSDAEIARLGPRLATHAAFPGGTNVAFARVGDDGIDLVVWERGAGLTMACGTGACATVAVACAKKLARYGTPVTVRLPGGALTITIDEASAATRMRGPARHVFSGRWP